MTLSVRWPNKLDRIERLPHHIFFQELEERLLEINGWGDWGSH
jgi:hypothetical protein